MGDTDTRPSSPMTTLNRRARATAAKKVEDLAAKVANNFPVPIPQRMNADQVDEALVELIGRLADIRASSDPHVFEELWQEKIVSYFAPVKFMLMS